MRQTTIGIAAVLSSVALAATANTPLPASSYDRQQPVSTEIVGTALESVCHLRTMRAWRFLGIRVPIYRLKFTGTGVLYRDRYIITAGHNVYEDNTDLVRVEIRCGTSKAVIRDRSQIDYVAKGWASEDADGYTGSPFGRDFGVIRMKDTIAVSRPFSLTTEPVQPGETVTFAGYPGERKATAGFPMTKKSDGFTLHSATATITSEPLGSDIPTYSGVAYYDLITYRSNSGGPVWRTGRDGNPELVAIHVMNFGGRIVDKDFRPEIDRLITILDARAVDRGE